MWTATFISLVELAAGAVNPNPTTYPITYTSCGVTHTLTKAPERVITMTQGATEFMLALGLENHMVGTAYLDDAIWPRYSAAYSLIPELSSEYPTETQIMNSNPDFVISSFNSAFRQRYNDSGTMKGIFSTVAPCTGTGGEETGMTETPSNTLTCRKELNNVGIGTFLFQDACEDTSLRPTVVSEEIVYEELRTLGRIFNVDGEHLVTQMKADFNAAQQLVSSNNGGTPLKAVWLDCVGRCCAVGEGEEPEVFVGAGNGVPQMLMNEADLTNLFANKEGNWACVKERDVIAAQPDVFIVVDAAWDTALSKLEWLYNQSAFCELDVLKAAQLVQIPFSATSLGPRNGPAALDLASAALHVGLGADLTSGSSGVGYFDPSYLKTQTAGLQCSIDMDSVKYDAAASGHPQIKSALWLLGLVVTLFVLI